MQVYRKIPDVVRSDPNCLCQSEEKAEGIQHVQSCEEIVTEKNENRLKTLEEGYEVKPFRHNGRS